MVVIQTRLDIANAIWALAKYCLDKRIREKGCLDPGVYERDCYAWFGVTL